MLKANTKQFAFPQNLTNAMPLALSSHFSHLPNLGVLLNQIFVIFRSEDQPYLLAKLVIFYKHFTATPPDSKYAKMQEIYLSFIYAKNEGQTGNPSSRHHHHISPIKKLGGDEMRRNHTKTVPKYRKFQCLQTYRAFYPHKTAPAPQLKLSLLLLLPPDTAFCTGRIFRCLHCLHHYVPELPLQRCLKWSWRMLKALCAKPFWNPTLRVETSVPRIRNHSPV